MGIIIFISPLSPNDRIRSHLGSSLGIYDLKSSINSGRFSGNSFMPTIADANPLFAMLLTILEP